MRDNWDYKKFKLEIEEMYLEVQCVVARMYEKTKDECWLEWMKRLKKTFNEVIN